MPDGKIPFDARNPDPDVVRQVVVERLRRDASWSQLDSTGDGFAPYVDYVGQDGRRPLLFLTQEVSCNCSSRGYWPLAWTRTTSTFRGFT